MPTPLSTSDAGQPSAISVDSELHVTTDPTKGKKFSSTNVMFITGKVILLLSKGKGERCERQVSLED